ncbi:MAG TPA: hypothetical protein VGJ69_02040 [Pyrinomonadaceae bacterium]|jgi:hypothetical protein
MSAKNIPSRLIFICILPVFLLICGADLATVGYGQDRTFTLSVAERGAVPNDADDDGPAFQQALDDVSAMGGTILVPSGRWVISTEVSSTNLGSRTIRFRGSGSDSVIVVNTPSARTFYLANAENVSFEQLTFVTADVASSNDAMQVIRVDGAKLATIRDCNFYGIATTGGPTAATIWFFSSFGILERVGFYGSTSTNSVVLWSNFRGAVVRNVNFLDYGEHNNVGYSKIPFAGLANAWVEVRDPISSPQNASTNGSTAVVENFIGDEGALNQVLIDPQAGGAGRRLHAAKLSNINGNVAGTNGVGILAADVDTLDISHSWFGYTSTSVPAVKLRRIGKGTLYGLTVGQGVDRYDIDATNTTVEIIASSPSSVPCAAQTCRIAPSYAEVVSASSIGGSGETGRLARWSDKSFLTDSSISDNFGAVQFSGSNVTFSNTGRVTFSNPGPVTFSNGGGVVFAGNVNLGGAPAVPVTQTSQDFVLGAQHAVILVDASQGRRQIYLPNPSTNVGKMYTIKKIDATSNVVKIESRTFSQDKANIDNVANLEFTTQYASYTVISDGNHWWIIAKK